MNYRPRHSEPRLVELARHFKVVLVTGARQAGKSTLLARVFPRHQSFVFDPVQDLYGARRDPDLFLDSFPPPLVLDEIQYAPELLPAIKRRVDRSDANGLYLLSGSQNLAALRSVSESLAGRVGILDLGGLTMDELQGRGEQPGWLEGFLDDPESLLSRLGGIDEGAGPLPRAMWRGALPGVLDLPDEVVPDYFRSYVATYVERDVRTFEGIRNLADYGRFLQLAASLTAQEVNASQLGREIGVAPLTARRWLDLLTHTYQWLELPPFHGNAVKRVSGKPKGHLRDTGLACSLARVSSPRALLASPAFGALFESWVVNELHRRVSTMRVRPQLYHWRSAGGAEVDLVLERDGRLFPVEAKAATSLSGHDTRGLRAFRETYGDARVAPAVIVFAGDRPYRVNPHTVAVPWNVLTPTRSHGGEG